MTIKIRKFGTQSLDLKSDGMINLTYFEILSKHLAELDFIKPNKWNTVQFYMMTDKKGGLWIGEIRVSDIKRRKV